MIKSLTLTLAALIAALPAVADFKFEEKPGELVLLRDGKPWMSTEPLAYDPARRDDTYKVFTHIYDFDGSKPITKGAGGKYPHHRGMFIGWKKTIVDGVEFNPWEARNAYQQHGKWLRKEAGPDTAVQSQTVQWRSDEGKPLVDEVRTITAKGIDGMRAFDFESVLTVPEGVKKVELRGDVQHAGMHVRLADEVNDHLETTEYIIPEGAVIEPNVQVKDVWWTCCSAMVNGKRWWVLHMTHPSLPTGAPDYSVRDYARFGAFFEPDLVPGSPLTLKFRTIVSDKALDVAACDKLYKDYAAK